MVPWSEHHKQETRERILHAAAAMLRERGIDRTSVAEIMQRAGLTHGGFYAHFESKDELVAEAVGHASAQVGGMFAAKAGGESSGDPVLNVAEKYLSRGHFEHVELGCPIAALGPELIRGGQEVRKVISHELRMRLDRLFNWTAAHLSSKVRRRQAAGTLACMVGGLIVARSLGDAEGVEFLEDCRGFLRDALSTPDVKAEPHR